MNTYNGNGTPPGGEDRDEMLRRFLDAPDGTATQTIPQHEAEEVPLPPPWLRRVIGEPALRVVDGRDRWYPRLMYVLIGATLVSVLAVGLLLCVGWFMIHEEIGEAREASERTEALLTYWVNREVKNGSESPLRRSSEQGSGSREAGGSGR